MKKLLIFLIIILILSGVAYFVFFNQEENSTDSLPNFFPLGAIRDIFNDSTNDPVNQIDDDSLIESSKTRKIVATAVAGFDLINLNNRQSLIYTDKNTGHIYLLDLNSTNTEATRISNITIAGIIDSVFNQDNEYLYTFIKDQVGRISLIKIPLSGLLSGDNATQNNSNMLSLPTISPDGNKIFFFELFNDGVLGILANPDLSERQIIWKSNITHWQSKWIDNQTIAINQPSSYYLSNNLYFLDIKTKTTKKILDNKKGLTSLTSPDKKYIFYTQSEGDNLTNIIKNTTTETEVILGIKTLADKCTWTTKNLILLYCAVSDDIFLGQYPDDWYQGKTGFTNDDIWGYIPEDNKLFRFVNLDTNIDIDKFNIYQSDFKDILIFRNKKDLNLWTLELTD